MCDLPPWIAQCITKSNFLNSNESKNFFLTTSNYINDITNINNTNANNSKNNKEKSRFLGPPNCYRLHKCMLIFVTSVYIF